METKSRKHAICGGNELRFECHDFEKSTGIWLDTKVFFNDDFLFTITGADVDKFCTQFDCLIQTYGI